ncbi:MAG: DsbC family protein [Rhodoferax sp.]
MPHTLLDRRQFSLGLIAAAATLAACSKTETAAPAASAALSDADKFDKISKGGKGFTVGALMSAHTVYVLFDPQCPHCGRLWQTSQPLLGKVKFVWIPVAIMGDKSTAQGATILSAPNPAEAMAQHEESLLARQGGISAMGTLPADVEAAIKANTAVFNEIGQESVPYLTTKNASSGVVVSNSGAMETEALARWVGLQ